MTSNELHEALRNTYPHPNFMYLKEVRDATGFDGVRTADAIAVGMYRSCGQFVHGFEIKVSRADWIKELSKPAKAESLMRYCHRWSVIVPDASLIQPGELPPTWGMGVWVQTRKNSKPRIHWIRQPPELHPQPISMVFFTAMLYAVNRIDAVEIQNVRQENFDLGVAHANKTHKDGKAAEDLAMLQRAVDAFETASGVSITKYTTDETAAKLATKFTEWRRVQGKVDGFHRELRWMKENAERIATNIAAEVSAIGTKI
jgi:hypothetical protein